MTTATMPVTERPLPSIPGSANKSDVWRDADGVLQQHAIELPVDKDTYKVNGRLFACQHPDCPTAEWVIEPKTEVPEGKKHCGRHGTVLDFVPLDDTQQDPIAVGRQRQLARLNRMWADKKTAYAQAIRDSAAVQAVVQTRATAPDKIAELAAGMKGHVPSLAAASAVTVGTLYVVDLTSTLEATAIGTAIGTCGAIAGYLIAVYAEKIRARLRKQGFQGRAARKARERGFWTGRAAVSTGVFMTVTGLVAGMAGGLDDVAPWQWGLLSLLALGATWWSNKAHWDRLWAERRRLRELAAENIRRAAEARARQAEQEALRAMEEARLRDQLADIGGEFDENDPVQQGQMMQAEWARISRLDTAKENFSQIIRTRILPEQTREITAPDPITGERVRIGWEFLGACEPGALVSRGSPVPPLQAAKEWIVSTLFDGRYDASTISLIDRPGDRQNTFMVMITERARLGDPVTWRAASAVRTTPDGTRWGFLGRALTGDDLEEVLYRPAQPFGGLVMGTTGGGKGGHSTRYQLNCLLSKIFPVLFDPKGLVDYADFVGIFPIGFTKRHRRMILDFLHKERQRREKRLAASPKKNRYGATVTGESRWNTHDPDTGEIGVYGEPMVSIWDEFHDMVKDQPFLTHFTNHVRFQRAAAMGALLLTQGGGLDDLGSSVLRDLAVQTSLTMYRSGDLQSRLAGGRNDAYSTADLPMMAGMCLRQAPGSTRLPMRAAYITRDPEAEDTVYTTLWGKGAEPVLQIEDPINWISEETKEIMKETGVWDLWMLARGPHLGGAGGLDALLADDQEDEEDETSQAVAVVGSKAVQPSAQQPHVSRMVCRNALLGMLHETPGLDWDGIMASDVWTRAPGWSAPPSKVTVSRAASELDGGTDGLPPGAVARIDRGAKSACWQLTEAGAEEGARQAALFRPREVPMTTAAVLSGQIPPQVLAEMAAQQAMEMATIAAAEVAAASRHG